MGSRTTRSIFAVTLCSGVAMVGAAVHGLVGVDSQLQRSVLDARKAERELGWKARVGLEEGLRRTFEWAAGVTAPVAGTTPAGAAGVE